MMKYFLHSILLTFWFSLGAALPSTAQVVPDATTTVDPASRLDQAESTYQINLGKLHAPIIQEYLVQLEALKRRCISESRQEEAKEVEAEIQIVRQLAATSGVLPYTVYESPATEAEAAPNKSESGNEKRSPKRGSKPALALTVNNAISPAATPGTVRTSLPLGSIIWQISALPAGRYDVMMIYSAPELAAAEPLVMTLGPTQVITSLPPDQATSGGANYRIFKLGSVDLAQPLASASLTLQSGNPAVPRIQVQSVLFMKARPGA